MKVFVTGVAGQLGHDVMNELKSPYVLEVHRYDEEKNEYYMEYADETLKNSYKEITVP